MTALRRTASLLFLLALCPGSSICNGDEPAAPPVAIDPSVVYPTGSILNIELEGGSISSQSSRYADFRLQLGDLWARGPNFFSLGAFAEQDFGLSTAFGIMGSYSDAIHGVWTQLGVIADDSGRAGYFASVGWSLFGVEAQRRFQSGSFPVTEWLLDFKIRVPLGIILLLLH